LYYEQLKKITKLTFTVDALLPQDFESVDTVSQRYPEAQSRT
jgi:hypothetical protein